MRRSLDEFVAALRQPSPTPYRPTRVPLTRHPSGWEPGIAWDGSTGTVASGPQDGPPAWEDLLRRWNLDPDIVEVVEPVQVRTWDVATADGDTRTLFYYKANVRTRPAPVDRVDVDALIAEVRRHKPSKRQPGRGEHALVVCLSDWQIGKGEGGGTEATVRRLLGMIDAVLLRLADLRSLGRRIETLYVVGMGDLVEGCDGHYGMQTFSVDLDRREQVKVVRRLLVKALTTWAPYVGRVVVACVPGNHGEHRKDGKAFTTFGDNDDVAVFEMAAEVLGANPDAYSHVAFVLPTDELAITLDVAGTVCAFAHGHQARTSGRTAQAKLRDWWEQQSFGDQPVGDARILVTGHYHHLSVVEYGARTHLQCPASDGGSRWFLDTSGQDARRGTLTFTVGPDGWDDLAVVASVRTEDEQWG